MCRLRYPALILAAVLLTPRPRVTKYPGFFGNFVTLQGNSDPPSVFDLPYGLRPENNGSTLTAFAVVSCSVLYLSSALTRAKRLRIAARHFDCSLVYRLP